MSYRRVFDDADISYNRFIRTTEDQHASTVRAAWEVCLASRNMRDFVSLLLQSCSPQTLKHDSGRTVPKKSRSTFNGTHLSTCDHLRCYTHVDMFTSDTMR